MTPEAQDVWNNLIKIGVPSLLSGFFGWLIARHSSQTASRKMLLERKFKMLDDVRQMVDKHFEDIFAIYGQAHGLLTAATTHSHLSLEVLESHLKPQIDAVFKKKTELLKTRNCVAPADSMLLMLGETKVEEQLAHLVACLDQLYLSVNPIEQFPFVEAAGEAVADRAREARLEFYKSIAEACKS